MRTIIKTSILSLFACILLACGKADNVGQNYQFDQQTTDGIAAFSVKCNIGRGDTTLDILRFNLDNQPQQPVDKNLYSASVRCYDRRDRAQPADLKILKLPNGLYEIMNWSQVRTINGKTQTQSAKTFRPILFAVKAHKVSYLGQIQIQRGSGEHYRVKVVNKKQQEMPTVKKRLPNIADNDFIGGKILLTRAAVRYQ